MRSQVEAEFSKPLLAVLQDSAILGSARAQVCCTESWIRPVSRRNKQARAARKRHVAVYVAEARASFLVNGVRTFNPEKIFYFEKGKTRNNQTGHEEYSVTSLLK